MLTDKRCQKRRVPISPGSDAAAERTCRTYRSSATELRTYDPNAVSAVDRCFDRLTVANTMSNVNTTLRSSAGTSIIVWRLASAKAEDEEGNRRKGAACAVNSEKIHRLSLHALQPSSPKFDARITLQPKIAGSLSDKSRSNSVDPVLPRALVKGLLQGWNHVEIILNHI